jgi:small subunit ribosomal protein S20
MPNTKSARKHMKTSLKNRARNRRVKTGLRREVKDFRAAVAAGKQDDAAKEAVAAQTQLDRAANRGIIHRNKAARMKSRMAKALKAAKAKA